jgi:hypothetical protein
VLQRLIAARGTQAPVHRLYRLPLAVIEQPFDVLGGRRPLGVPTETGLQRIQKDSNRCSSTRAVVSSTPASVETLRA